MLKQATGTISPHSRRCMIQRITLTSFKIVVMRAAIAPLFLLFAVLASGTFLMTYHKKVLNSDYAKKMRTKNTDESPFTEIASFVEYSFSIFNPVQEEPTAIAAGEKDTAMRSMDYVDQLNPLIFRN